MHRVDYCITSPVSLPARRFVQLLAARETKKLEAEMAVNTSLGDCTLFCMQWSIFLRNDADYPLDPQASKLRDEEISSHYIKELLLILTP